MDVKIIVSNDLIMKMNSEMIMIVTSKVFAMVL